MEPLTLPPHDLEMEQALLSVLLIDGNAFAKVSSLLSPSSFYSEAHRRIFEAMEGLARSGTPIDAPTVGLRLRALGRIEQIGGMTYLTELLPNAPSVHNVETYAKAIVERAAIRDLMREAQDIEANARLGNYTDPVAFLANAHERILQISNKLGGGLTDKVKAISPSEIVGGWAHEGPLIHEPCGIDALDNRTGGGPVYGTRWYIVGAPNASKTAIIVQVAHEFAERGIAVGILAVDEEASDVVTRLAQRAGFSRHECEGRDPRVIDELVSQLRSLPIRLYGPEWTIERAAADLDAFAKMGGMRAALFVDSIQTATSEKGKGERDARTVVTANVYALRAVASQYKLITMATSEMNRGAYRSIQAAEQSNDMASAAESRAVEFSARVMLAVRSVGGESDKIEVGIAKNKHGHSDVKFYLQLDRSRMTLRETDAPDVPEKKKQKRTERDDARKILQIVFKQPGLGARELRAHAKAHHGFGSTRVDAAKVLLVDGFEGYRLEDRGDNRGAKFHAVPIVREEETSFTDNLVENSGGEEA